MELMLKATGLSMPVSAQNVATFTQKCYMNIESVVLVKKYVTFNLLRVCMQSNETSSVHHGSSSRSQIHVWCSEGVFAVLWLSKSGIWLWLWSDLFIHMKVESRALLSWALRARASNSCLIRADFSCSNWVMRSLFSVTSWGERESEYFRSYYFLLVTAYKSYWIIYLQRSQLDLIGGR